MMKIAEAGSGHISALPYMIHLLPSPIYDTSPTYENYSAIPGHDTTASGMGWTLFFLGSRPELQEKIFEEVDAIFGQFYNFCSILGRFFTYSYFFNTVLTRAFLLGRSREGEGCGLP